MLTTTAQRFAFLIHQSSVFGQQRPRLVASCSRYFSFGLLKRRRYRTDATAAVQAAFTPESATQYARKFSASSAPSRFTCLQAGGAACWFSRNQWRLPKFAHLARSYLHVDRQRIYNTSIEVGLPNGHADEMDLQLVEALFKMCTPTPWQLIQFRNQRSKDECCVTCACSSIICRR